jgi:hypothetical protein
MQAIQMNKVLFTLGAALLLANASWAVKPSEDAINACLKLGASGQATYDKLDISEFQSEDNFKRGYQATLFSDKGQRIGYAEKSGKDDALIWGRWLLPLVSAKAFNDQKDEPSEFTPMLAMWGYVHDGKQRLLCVNFNFDGIGRSGSFQKVHGLYLMPIRASKKTKPDLYYGVLNEAP